MSRVWGSLPAASSGLRWGAGLRDLRPPYRLGLCASPSSSEILRGDPSDSPRRGFAPTDPAGVSKDEALGGLGWGVEGCASLRQASPVGSAAAPCLEEVIAKGDVSGRLCDPQTPRRGPSTRLRMYFAPTDPAGVAESAWVGGLSWGVKPHPRFPFRFAKGRRAPFSDTQRGAGADATSGGRRRGVGGGCEVASSLGAPRSDDGDARGRRGGVGGDEGRPFASFRMTDGTRVGLRGDFGGGREIAWSLGAPRNDGLGVGGLRGGGGDGGARSFARLRMTIETGGAGRELP